MNTPIIMGRQTFDGLGRQLTVETGPGITRYHYLDGQLPPSANTLADGRRVEFTYEPQLNNQLLSVTPTGEAAQMLTYHPLGMPASSTGALGSESFGFSPSGQPTLDSWTVDNTTHDTRWHYSMNGLLQGFVDPQGTQHQRSLDAHGRVEQTRVGNLGTRYRYDGLSRPISIMVGDPDRQRSLTTSLTYDTMGREHTRTFVVTEPDEAGGKRQRTFVQTLGYSALDQITTRTWREGKELGEETFEYDIRGRLVKYTATPFAAPQDPFGNRIINQVFSFNAFNGHERVVTRYSDQTVDDARFTYASDNPAQVVKISHSHPDWPKEVTLTYDACGRVVNDSLGRSMVWNAQDRLVEVRHARRRCQYGYTAHGRLSDRTVDGVLTRSFFSGQALTHEQSGGDSLGYHAGELGVFAISTLTAGIRQTTLLGADAQGSVRLEADSTLRIRRYSAYGAERQDDEHVVRLGYAGQRSEALTGWQILGDYRPYDPVLMCFLSPDSESPFGRGGINPYTYCAGDPVNRIDPDGHSWVSYLATGAGIALGLLGLIPGLQALPAVSVLFGSGVLTTTHITALASVTLDVLSLATGAASSVLEAKGHDGSASAILGGISFVTGLAGAGAGLKLARLQRAGRAQRALDQASGWAGPKPERLGQATSFFKDSSGTVHVGLIDNFQESGKVALLTHGDPLRPVLMDQAGNAARAADVARDLVAPRLKALAYPADKEIILLSCWGGRNGAAKAMSEVLGNPVRGFTEKIYVKGFASLQSPASAANTPLEAIPYLSRLRASGNPFKAWKTTFREARSRVFHANGAVSAA